MIELIPLVGIIFIVSFALISSLIIVLHLCSFYEITWIDFVVASLLLAIANSIAAVLIHTIIN